MKTVSVIIPAQNFAIYLHDCLQSVINQTYKNLEIICVYSPSSDDTLAILSSYASNDHRIHILHNNTGISTPAHTRNMGIDAATGTYIRFVDADDALNPESIAELVTCIESGQHDAARGGHDFCSSDLKTSVGVDLLSDTYLREQNPLSVPNHLFAMLRYGHWDYLFNLQKIRTWNARYSDDVFIGEDTLFLHSVLFQAKSVCITPKSVYKYRVRPGSAMTGTKKITWFTDILYNYDHLYTLARQHEVLHLADYCFLHAIPNYFMDSVLTSMKANLDEEEQKKVFLTMRELLTKHDIFFRLNHKYITDLGVYFTPENALLLMSIWMKDFATAKLIINHAPGWFDASMREEKPSKGYVAFAKKYVRKIPLAKPLWHKLKKLRDQYNIK